MQELNISVVTVCLNTVDTIEETIESVLGQTYSRIEYVIVDGMSIDGTLEVIQKYEKTQRIKMVSGKDRGLYHAMNKGIDLCTGDYILFLNSGDVFADRNAVSEVIAHTYLMPDIIYGNVTKIYQNQSITERYSGKKKVFKLLMTGKMPCHQGIFTKASVLKKFRFDESYQICADFDFLMRCVREHVSMQYVDVVVSVVDCVTGISSRKDNLDRMRAEDDRSIRKNYPVLYYLMKPVKALVRKYWQPQG